MKRLLPIFAVAAAAAGLPTAAAAQSRAGDRVNTVIIFGDDECPPSTGEEIVVCARMDEGERFRIPVPLRGANNPANQSWVSRIRSYETVGDFGPLSCTPVGAGGELGCTAQFIEGAYEARRRGTDVRFSQLIAEARAERLSTIDAEAAETQARVEQVEAEYLERQRREQEAEEGAAAAAETPPATPARVVDPLAIPPAP